MTVINESENMLQNEALQGLARASLPWHPGIFYTVYSPRVLEEEWNFTLYASSSTGDEFFVRA